MEEFVKIVILSNDLIDEIPRSLKVAEPMMKVLRPPKEIYDFIKLCRYMMDEFIDGIKRRC